LRSAAIFARRDRPALRRPLDPVLRLRDLLLEALDQAAVAGIARMAALMP
jgi:hypothetical protein